MQYTINGQFQFEGSNYRQKERKRGKHLLLHGDIFNQRDSIESSRAYGGVHESFYQTSKGRVIFCFWIYSYASREEKLGEQA